MTHRALNAGLAIFFVLGLLATARLHHALSEMTSPPPIPSDPKRIVSLAPSVTETLFALGLGPRVVGVTQYCHFPPEVLDLPKVAGFTDVNIEAVLRSRPDLVILPVDKVANRQELERLGLAVMTLDTRSLDGYLATVPELGRATGHVPEALEITSALERAIVKARARAEGRPRPRVLFSVMRSYQGLGSLTEITAVGGDGFFSQMLSIAGGENVYQGPLSFPKLSREAIMTLNPAIVVDLVQGLADAGPARADWDSLGGSVAAVRDGRVHLFTDESDTVPGPRIHRTITKLSEAFFPEGDPPQAGPPEAGPAQAGPPDADPAPAAGSASGPPDQASPAPAAPAGAPLQEGLHG